MIKKIIDWAWTAKTTQSQENEIAKIKKPDGYKSSQSSSVIRLHSSTK